MPNTALPSTRPGQAQLQQHNADAFPGPHRAFSAVPLPAQEMQREGFTATRQIRDRKPCQSKHRYREGTVLTKMTVRERPTTAGDGHAAVTQDGGAFTRRSPRAEPGTTVSWR